MVFDRIVAAAMGMFVLAMIGVAAFLGLDGLDDELVSNQAYCGRNSSGGTSGTILYTGCPEGWNASQQATIGVANVYDLAPTWGTMIGVGALLAIVGGFVLLGIAGYGYGKKKGMF